VDANAERVARNEAVFREANDRIEGSARDNDFTGLVPFICECAEVDCTEIIQLSLAQYEEVRSHPRRFAVAPGHEDDEPSSRLVSEHERFAIVEKTGEAGELVERKKLRAQQE
jgi:hypothetical protein